MSKNDFQALFYNEDQTLKQGFIKGMDKYFADLEYKEQQYASQYYEHDLEVVRKYLVTNICVCSDTNDYVHNIKVKDLQAFCNHLYNSSTMELDIPESDTYTASIRLNKDLVIELICGQGSYFRVSTYNPCLDIGAGI